MIISLVSDFIVFSISTKIFFTFEWRRCSSWSRFFLTVSLVLTVRPSSHPTALQYTKSIFLTKKVMNMNTKLFIMNI